MSSPCWANPCFGCCQLLLALSSKQPPPVLSHPSPDTSYHTCTAFSWCFSLCLVSDTCIFSYQDASFLFEDVWICSTCKSPPSCVLLKLLHMHQPSNCNCWPDSIAFAWLAGMLDWDKVPRIHKCLMLYWERCFFFKILKYFLML